MNSKKIILRKVIIAIICFLVLLSTNVLAIVKPTSNFYVNDYADLLNSETESYIMSVNQSLNSKTKAQVVVVTVKNLEGKSLEEYSTELFRNFGIGDKTLNNGVLMLIALEERQSRIEVGYGLEGILNDAKTGRIQDEYMIPYLKQNNWDEGIKNGFNAIINEIEKEYDITVGSEKAIVVESSSEVELLNEIYSLTMIPIILTIILKVFTKNKKNKVIIRTIYMFLLAIITFIICRSVILVLVIELFNLFVLISKMGGYYGGGYSGRGGFSSGGGFSRRRFLWWWRSLRWWTEVQEVFKSINIIKSDSSSVLGLLFGF